jgi:hypothetical protein
MDLARAPRRTARKKGTRMGVHCGTQGQYFCCLTCYQCIIVVYSILELLLKK